MEGGPLRINEQENSPKKQIALKVVANILGYSDTQEMLDKGKFHIRTQIVSTLKDYAEASDLLEDDKETIGSRDGTGSMNVEFIELFNQAVTAGLMSPDDLDVVYPPTPSRDREVG